MAEQVESIKWIPGTKFMVDGFRFQNPGCQSYFLTHAHADHTTGLAKSFAAGIIFCTPITARLLRKNMGMPAERIMELELDVPRVIDSTEVVPIDANHCPGSCMFLFRTKDKVILHTGDLRWDDRMAEHPAIKAQRIDLLFLDTTYASPKHTHPPQDEVVEKMIKIMKKEAKERPKTLFVVGSYHIGKERAYFGAAKALNWKVWCDANKRRVLKMLGLPDEYMRLLVTKPFQGRIHVQPLFGLQPEKLQEQIKGTSWTHVCAFRPTGWTFRKSGKVEVRQEGDAKIYGVPYSEHSSFPELRACVAALRPRRLIPTVNARNAAAARNLVNRFADLMDLSEDRSRLDFFLRKHASQSRVPTPALPAVPQDTADSCASEAISDDLDDAGPADDSGWAVEDDGDWDAACPENACTPRCEDAGAAERGTEALAGEGDATLRCMSEQTGVAEEHAEASGERQGSMLNEELVRECQEDAGGCIDDDLELSPEPGSPAIQRCSWLQGAEDCSDIRSPSPAGSELNEACAAGCERNEVDLGVAMESCSEMRTEKELCGDVKCRIERASPPFREQRPEGRAACDAQFGRSPVAMEVVDLQRQVKEEGLLRNAEAPTTGKQLVLSEGCRSRSECLASSDKASKPWLHWSSSAPAATAVKEEHGATRLQSALPKAEAGCGTAGTVRSDSCKSSSDHIDVGAIDVWEQQRILAAIEESRKRRAQQLAACLTKKKQSTLGAFFRSD